MNNREKGPFPWTVVGVERQRRIVAAAETRYRSFIQNLDDGTGANSSAADDVDLVPILDEKRQLKQAWEDAETFLTKLRAVDTDSLDTTIACTGLVIRGQYLSSEMIAKRGQEETFLLGGVGESDSDAQLRTYSCTSPLGRAVKGNGVGDIVVVLTPDDGAYQFEVLEIWTLDEVSMVRAMTSIRKAA